jgi:hypothetical protein
MVDMLEREELYSEADLNQETSFIRPGDTRWGSHYTTLFCVNQMWLTLATLYVLCEARDEGHGLAQVPGLIEKMEN